MSTVPHVPACTGREMDAVSFDEYGFLISREDQDGTESRSHDYSAQPNSATAESWTAVCNSWNQHTEKDSPQKVRQLLRKGVPRQLRSQVWQLFLNSKTLRAQSTFDYKLHLSEFQSKLQSLDLSNDSNSINIRKLNLMVDKLTREAKASGVENLEEVTSPSDAEGTTELMFWARTTRQIMMDIVRTFPCHQVFMSENTEAKRSLLHILALYCVHYNTTVGYCQGMAYVAALLLMNDMPEEDAFWALVSLFERSKYLAGFYDSSLSKIKTYADVFGLLLKERLPQLGHHLESLGIHPLIYVTPWFMCLFTTLPCWDTVLTICDLLFLEGINTIFRAALAIMEVCSAELLAMYQIGDVVPFLQNIPSRLVSLKNFSRVLWQTTVHKWEIELYQDMVLRGDMEVRERRAAASQITDGRSQGAEDNDGGIGEEGGGERRRERRKRRAGGWEDGGEEEGERLPSSKKRRKADGAGSVATPTSSNQSLFSRLVSAITPAASRARHPAKMSETAPRTRLSSIKTPGTTTNRSKFKTPSTRPRSKHPYSYSNKASSILKFPVTSLSMAAGGEEGIEMKDFSTSLRRREESEGRDLTTRNCSNKENESGTCMHNHYSRMPNSETGLPILELDATSPVTKNTLQISSEKPYQHMLDVYRTPPFAFNSQSPGVSKNSTDVCNNENRTLTTADRSSSIVIRSPLRRSVRLAKRRSVGQCAPQAAGYLSSPLLKDSGSSNFPVPSLLSPRLERPLQDYVQSTSAHPWDHHAFRIFSTPTPLRLRQVTNNGPTTLPGKSSSVISSPASPWQPTPSAAAYSPEVELQPLVKKR